MDNRLPEIEDKLDNLVRLVQGFPCRVSDDPRAKPAMGSAEEFAKTIFKELAAKRGQFSEQQDVYTPAEFAVRVNRRKDRVQEWCRTGRINAKRIDGFAGKHEEVWQITHAELLRYRAERLLPPDLDRNYPEGRPEKGPYFPPKNKGLED